MGLLKKIGIVRSDNKSSKIFESIFDKVDFIDVPASTPSEYVNKYYDTYIEKYGSSNSLNGNIFELIISTLFVRCGLYPFYLQAKVAFVPNVEYDCLMYCKSDHPICFSLKTSLRERYKQADLEAVALKYVHRKAKNYLLTLNINEAKNISTKIKNGEVLGLDKVILCSTSEIDNLIEELKKEELVEAGSREIITSNFIITDSKIKKYVNLCE